MSALGGVEIFPGNGDGTFGAPLFTPVAGAAGRLAVADFDGNGRPDVAVPLTGVDGIALLAGKADGTLAPPRIVTASTQPLLDGVEAIACGDLDGDGRPDLAAVVSHGNDTANPIRDDAVVALLNQGKDRFSPGPDVDLGDGEWGVASALAVASFEGSAGPDLAVGLSVANGGGGGVVDVVQNQGNGKFGSPRQIGLETSTDQLAPGDFDGGGLAVGGELPDLLPGGSLGSVQSLPAGGAAPDLAADLGVITGDFNGDGNNDVAVFDPSAGTVQLLLDQPAPSAAAATIP